MTDLAPTTADPQLQAMLTAPEADALRLSEYSCAMVDALHRHLAAHTCEDVLDVGVGNGILLATAAQLGARNLHGVDVDAEAVLRAAETLSLLEPPRTAELKVADMWAAFPGRQFDLIIGNLPQFPTEDGRALPGRRPFWSAAGPKGDRLISQFLTGLDAHLKPGGTALMSQTCWVDMQPLLAGPAIARFERQIVGRFLIHVTPEKRMAMAPGVRTSPQNGLVRIGQFLFATVNIWRFDRHG